ncbi:glycosyl transferase [Rhizobium halophytocola]|uniref:O-linked N-acetylglucosamine transferase (SPINDLY family) n=1 Tax=Rhizobium halophytocola TaxID=735519 RepID=A0ABS4DX43_9HYPH|nr:glycosyl transferase [Rhizobium halophytocola]MBP1850235.1 putative O-linked N-acetylglucosamine transferase (SPINDLY family) [Rhizobium halophytocola]
MSDMQAAMKEYQAGRLPQALKLASRALPNSGAQRGGLLALIGNIEFKLGHREAAADAFSEAAGLTPAKAPEFLKLATTLYLGAGRRDRVAEIGPDAVDRNPSDSAFAFEVANVLFTLGERARLAPLLAHLDRANDRHMALIINFQRLTRRFEQLWAELQAAASANPDNLFLQISRYAVSREVCAFDVQREYEAIMRTPDTPQAQALLSGEAALARILWSGDEALNARPSQDSLKYAGARVADRPPQRRAFSPEGAPITIGYLSNDFFDHATMTLFREVMGRHDPQRFRIKLFCYTPPAIATQQASWPEALQKAVIRIDHLDDKAAAAVIASHGVDILVDLKGHTMGARLGIVNASDAPVKATYLGFPGSVTGIDLDYAITDRIVTPDSSIAHFSETLCRLPETYQANNWQTRPKPEYTERADHGLPEDAFIFASFNATYKITPATLDLWCRVLKQVPDAVFWVYMPSAFAGENFLKALEAAGIARERVVLTGMTAYDRHVSRLPLADVGLDAIPCSGHTTTSDMLWAGLPILSLHGTAFAGRVSESLLNAIGLPELVCADEESFVDLAVRLAEDPQLLFAFRQRLENNRLRAPLFDGERFTRHLEAAYEAMAARARSGLAPELIDVAALPPRGEPFGP